MPYDLVFGLPLLLIGIGFVVNGLTSTFLAIFSSGYNRRVCTFCS